MKHSGMNCMTVIIGRAVSETGRVMVAHNEDDPGHVLVRRAYVPAADHPEGTLIPAEQGLARIPQVRHTFGYYWIEYVMDEGGLTSADSFLNENGVLITSNSMGRSKEDPEDASLVKDGGIGYVLRRALAERATSARDGARILMELVEEWGYAPSGRAYTIADKDEAFMFQLARGHRYIGARVPDDAIVVMPNHYDLHTLADVPEMFYPADLVDHAIEKGWYVPQTEDRSDFDFAAAYQGEKSWRAPGNLLRQKNGQRIVLGRPQTFDNNEFCVYPQAKHGIDTMARVMMCHYEGTEDDTGLFGPGRSPHNSPTHRRICTGTTLESDLWVFGETPEQTVVYTCPGRPCQVPYMPIHPLRAIPEALLEADDPAERMATHLEPHPGVTAAREDMNGRIRRLCSEMELQYSEHAEPLSRLLWQLLEEGRCAEDESAFMEQAISRVEAYAADGYRRIRIESVGDIARDTEGASFIVRFCCDAQPIEAELRFGIEYTHTADAFSPAREGSLRCVGENCYEAEFDAAPLLSVAPVRARQELWLGGRDVNDHAFAGCTIAEV